MKNLRTKLSYAFYTLLACVFLSLTSCTGDAKTAVQDGDFKIEFLFEKYGCKMYRFKDGGRYIYWSNCDGRTEYSYYRSTGKSGYTVYEQSVTSNAR
jgi:hypothetical protein